MRANALDHVALWMPEREELAAFLCDHLGMHVIEQDDDFTLVGADARRGKLTLFAAEGPRQRGALERVVVRVRDPVAAARSLPATVRVSRRNGVTAFQAPGGLELGLVAAPGDEYDIDHVVLRVEDPETVAHELAALGFSRRNGFLAVADKAVQLVAGSPAARLPLLNHLALLVDSADEVRDEATRRGLEIVKVVDAANTKAVFVAGPGGVQIEYVEHKPSFSLV